MNTQLYVLIMAGGSGTRFWPVSRSTLPKQFLNITGDKSMLRLTVERFLKYIPPHLIWVLTSDSYRELTQKELPELPPENIVGEPMRRDTAAAIMLGASIIERLVPEAHLLFLPADHIILPQENFMTTILSASSYLETHEYIITFGITPTEPLSRFGYIKRGEKKSGSEKLNIYDVASFIEKPPVEKAKIYLAEGGYYWNSGIFLWRLSTLLNAFDRYLPLHRSAGKKIAQAWDTPKRDDVLMEEFKSLKPISIDYGVMEKVKNIAVVEATFNWDDVGGWDALTRLHSPDQDGNISLGPHVGIGTKNCVVFTKDLFIGTVGIEDIVVVATPDAILVAHKDKLDKVKDLTEMIRKKGFEGLV